MNKLKFRAHILWLVFFTFCVVVSSFPISLRSYSLIEKAWASESLDSKILVSSFVGGKKNDVGRGIAVDVNGNVYSSLLVCSAKYCDTQVNKFDPIRKKYLYKRILHGSKTDDPLAMTVDNFGNAYIVGSTNSVDFPVINAYQPIYGGGQKDAFITKLDQNGNLLFSTFLGGTGTDEIVDVTLDDKGNIYLTGSTNSSNFPTRNPFQAIFAGGPYDGFLTTFNDAGSILIYSTYLGGEDSDVSTGVALDTTGHIYLTGNTFSHEFPTQNPYQANLKGDEDAFITKFSPSASSLIFSTYFGGSDYDATYKIITDNEGNAYVSGTAYSLDLPLVNPIQGRAGNSVLNPDIFISEISADGQMLVFSTYFGGLDDDAGSHIALDSKNNIYVTGNTNAVDFPLLNPTQSSFGGYIDGIILKISSAKELVFSTYVGGSSWDDTFDMVVRPNLIITIGQTQSPDFPLVKPFDSKFEGNSEGHLIMVTLEN